MVVFSKSLIHLTMSDNCDTQRAKGQGVWDPLITAQEIMHMGDEEIIALHSNLPPIRAKRMDWRKIATKTSDLGIGA